MNPIGTLSPQLLWNHFADICSIPHPSKHETAILEHIKAFANKCNLQFSQDTEGNIVIYKPATPGMEQLKTICLQAHVDMVPQKNTQTVHDFTKDAIIPRIVGDVVKATETTLGADNGIGLAAILGILESNTIIHGPIEALFTTDEETGMTGAKHLDPTLLSASYMINTDSEIENEITIGCAGGIDGNFIFPIKTEILPKNYKTYSIEISGLQGGHSGFEIHLGRAHANKIITEIVYNAVNSLQAKVHSISGGNMRNAIPREAKAIISIPPEFIDLFETYIILEFQAKKQLHFKTDVHLNISIKNIDNQTKIWNKQTTQNILQALLQCPQGVIQFDSHSGAVITSTNLSILQTNDSEFEVNCLLRSTTQIEKQKLATEMQHVFELFGAKSEFIGDYPGWQPKWDSPLNEIVSNCLELKYGSKPKIEVVHAGLECGIFSGIYPQIEYISFGPTIRNPHSPDEEVDIQSVLRFWDALLLILQNIPKK